MKRMLLTGLGCLLTLNLLGQGTVISVSFRDIINGLTGELVSPLDPSPIIAQLYISPVESGPMVAVEAPSGFDGPGRWDSGALVVLPMMPGGPVWVQLRAWEAAFGNSYDAAVGAPPLDIGGVNRRALVGVSGVHAVPVFPAPPTTTTILPGFTLYPVPEPSAGALAMLGSIFALAWLLRRVKP